MRLAKLGWLMVTGLVVGCASAPAGGLVENVNPPTSDTQTIELPHTPIPTTSTPTTSTPTSPASAPPTTVPEPTIPPSDTSAPTSSTEPPTTQTSRAESDAVLRDGLDALIELSGALGGIAAVRHGSSEPVIVTAGVIDDGGTPMTSVRPFPIASVTKRSEAGFEGCGSRHPVLLTRRAKQPGASRAAH